MYGIYYLDGRNEINERIIGTIISIHNSRKIKTPKPILGCTNTSTEKIKVSMRIPRLLKNKINLNLLLKAVVDEINPEFEVGGHKTAAGALISEDSLNDFVSRINQLVEEGL